MFGSNGNLRVASNPGLASIGALGTSSSLNGMVVVNSLDDDYLMNNKEGEEDLEEGELEISIETGDEDADNTLNDV